MPFVVRLAAVEEVPLVHGIMLQAFEEYRRAEVPSSALNESVEAIREAVGSGREQAVLCVADGVPIGSARFQVDGETLYFARLSVVPQARGTGAAKAMLSWLEAHAQAHGQRRMRCRVRMSVPRNITLYRARGFDVVKEETVVNANGFAVRTVVMAKNL